MSLSPTFTQVESVNGEMRVMENDALKLTDAEKAAGLTGINFAYAPDDARRYGIIANDSNAATNNTTYFRNLPASFGKLRFPNVTGADIYYFNGVVLLNDGIHIDLMQSTLHFSGTGSGADTNSGFLLALRDFSIENGSIEVVWATSTSTSSGNAIQIGARGTDTSYVTFYDDLALIPLGNIRMKNLRIDMNVSGAGVSSSAAISLIGGIQNLRAENIRIFGHGTLAQGITYEFGWATSPSTGETSHANNMTFKNIRVESLSTSVGIGMVLAGVYNTTIDGLYVLSAASILSVTPGESLYYNPWVGFDEIGVKHNIHLKHITGRTITGTAVSMLGAQLASGGYLSATVAALGHPGDYQAQTDLADYVLEGFSIDGTSGGFGILCSARSASIRNGVINGFEQGIFGTDEWTRVRIDGTDVFNCTKTGINLDGGSNIYPTARKKTGYIRNCNIAANSTSSAGSYPGILLNKTASFLVEACRINRETAYDGVDETTQGNAVQLGSAAAGVVCKANRVGVILGGSFAYYNTNGTPPSADNAIENPTGDTTYSGLWDGVVIAATPTLTAATVGNLSVTYSVRELQYVKRGNQITYSFRIETSAFTHTTASGILKLTGMPYTVKSGNMVSTASLMFGGVTKAGYTQFTPYAAQGQTYLGVVASGTATAAADVNITDLPTGGTVLLRGSGHYFT